MVKEGPGGKRKGCSKIWTPEENKKFYQALQKFGSDFQVMETMFSGRTRKELKNKFKREEKTWKKGKELGLKAWEADDLIAEEKSEVARASEVKRKSKKQAGPRRRYKNKGFYESSSGEDSAAEEEPVKLKDLAVCRVASSKRVRQGLPRMPVLMHMKQEAVSANQEEKDRKSGGLLPLLDPYGIPAS